MRGAGCRLGRVWKGEVALLGRFRGMPCINCFRAADFKSELS
jgi:hypothetical protein